MGVCPSEVAKERWKEEVGGGVLGRRVGDVSIRVDIKPWRVLTVSAKHNLAGPFALPVADVGRDAAPNVAAVAGVVSPDVNADIDDVAFECRVP